MYRERASRTYSSFIYLLSLIAIELPYILINTVTFVYAHHRTHTPPHTPPRARTHTRSPY